MRLSKSYINKNTTKIDSTRYVCNVGLFNFYYSEVNGLDTNLMVETSTSQELDSFIIPKGKKSFVDKVYEYCQKHKLRLLLNEPIDNSIPIFKGDSNYFSPVTTLNCSVKTKKRIMELSETVSHWYVKETPSGRHKLIMES